MFIIYNYNPFSGYYQDFYDSKDQDGTNYYEYPADDGAEIEPAEQGKEKQIFPDKSLSHTLVHLAINIYLSHLQ